MAAPAASWSVSGIRKKEGQDASREKWPYTVFKLAGKHSRKSSASGSGFFNRMFGGSGSSNSSANNSPPPPAASSSASSSGEGSKADAHPESHAPRRRTSHSAQRVRIVKVDKDLETPEVKANPDPASLLTYLPEGPDSATEAQLHPPPTSILTGVRQSSPPTALRLSSTSPRISSSSFSTTRIEAAAEPENTVTAPAKQGHGRNKSSSKGHKQSASSSNETGTSSAAPGKHKKNLSRAATFIANAKHTLHLSSGSGGSNNSNNNNNTAARTLNAIDNIYSRVNRMRSNNKEMMATTQLQRLGRSDPTLLIPQGSLNNSAGESVPGLHSSFRVGVAEDKNRSCRRTMEDAHSFIYNYLGVPRIAAHANPTTMTEVQKVIGNLSTSTEPGTNKPAPEEPLDEEIHTKETPTPNLNIAETDNGFFAVYDGHAGSLAADWCGKKIHLIVEDIIRAQPHRSVAELLDEAFQEADHIMAETPMLKNSGCTAVVAVMRWEDRIPPETLSPRYKDRGEEEHASPITNIAEGTIGDGAKIDVAVAGMDSKENEAALKSLDAEHDPSKKKRVRMLYVANVGDSRAIICRNGTATRLTYDHKGSDPHEGRRVADCGGMILNYRVNGVLAVTRALGDSYMKDLVSGRPYTTETMVNPDTDEFLILACDGIWDVCTDQEAVDLIRDISDAQVAAQTLVEHALSQFSADNLSCMVVKFDKEKMHAVLGHAVVPAGMTGTGQRRYSSTAEASVAKAQEYGEPVCEGYLPAPATTAGTGGEVTRSLLDDYPELSKKP
ncbi:Protein phosphatase 2C 1 [Ascosphaera pollenicola]|nr:Protein phosphatase 2C 1 [Ascosphaera pollenicola]